ncbi:uncharacterized protein [Clytia hemisphaerica]|uniref:uncharacterized protein n=1 Tax=Clytia hemisphaerica TaxID=252671 RepID=UPI0034D42069
MADESGSKNCGAHCEDKCYPFKKELSPIEEEFRNDFLQVKQGAKLLLAKIIKTIKAKREKETNQETRLIKDISSSITSLKSSLENELSDKLPKLSDADITKRNTNIPHLERRLTDLDTKMTLYLFNMVVKTKEEGKLREGFTGKESRIVYAENSKELYTVDKIGTNFTCRCQTYTTYHVCEHTLASAFDNGDDIFDSFLDCVVSKQKRLTPSATSGACPSAGKKKAKKKRKRNHWQPPEVSERIPLANMLEEIKPDEEVPAAPYAIVNTAGSKMVIKKDGSKKPNLIPTRSTPFMVWDIRGNISKCAACRENLVDGPDDRYHPLDSQVCIRHEESDYYYNKQVRKWFPTKSNKYYHLSKECLEARNPHFQFDNLRYEFLIVNPANEAMKNTLRRRFQS